MPTLFRIAVTACLIMLPWFLWADLFAQALAAPVPPAPHTVTHDIGPNILAWLTLLAGQLVAAFTAYLAYRRSAATETKAAAIEVKTEAIEKQVETTATSQKEASAKTDKGLGDIYVAVNSKYEQLEHKFTASQSHVMKLIEQLAAANATVIANAAAAVPPAVATQAKPEEIKVDMRVEQMDVKELKAAKMPDPDDAREG